ncbi:MAG: hypothetical protein R6U95_08245 [Bacteroidales bacterium]
MSKKLNLLSIILFIAYFSHAQYNWGNLPLGGGGFVSAVIASETEENVIYARTDVGGAYRWEAHTETWTPLNDWIQNNETGLWGIESLALSAQESNMVFMFAGIDYFDNGKSAILISDDYGETFTQVEVTSQFKAHGNGMGRQTGERLVVDPNNSDILFCGTRRDGLFKSTDGGYNWSEIASFPVTTTANDNGICFVEFDNTSSVQNGATQRIFAGVSRSGNTNLYVSEDGGNTWNAIPSQPTTYMPQRMAQNSNGSIFITYGNGSGPHAHWDIASESMDAGAVWKYEHDSETWTDITPSITSAYGGIAVDPTNPDKIIVSTINTYLQQPWGWGDRICVSTDGGNSWTDLFENDLISMDNNNIPWIIDHAIHWAGSLCIDPFNTDRVFVTSGNGIFMTEHISTTTNHSWKFMVKGIEETVPLDIVSIPNGPVITVIGDYDGSVYHDKNTYPELHKPEIGTSTGIDFAYQNSDYVVRTGGDDEGNSFPLYYSTDMGETWTQFATKPNGELLYKGKAAISADGSTVVWGAENSSTLYKTTDWGTTWTDVTGVSVENAYPVADAVNPDKFYLANGNTIYVSTDGGSSFSAQGTTGYTDLKKIRATPGIEGDIWAPCGTNGLYRSTNSGTDFSNINSVSACSAVGFGKAIEGNTFPTIYIWGTVGGTTGIFQSTDEGATWTQINDDNHEFGGPANGQFVIGDMNEYGTVYMSTAGRGTVYGSSNTNNNCTSPDLGKNFSLCGLSNPIILDSHTSVNQNTSYTWYKDGTPITGEQAATLEISEAGTYRVERDSATCSNYDEISVSATIPQPDLGGDKNICASASITLNCGISEEIYTYEWTHNAEPISQAHQSSITVSETGTYTCTISAEGCSSVSDNSTVSSDLLSVSDDTICSSGQEAFIEVTNNNGPYEWYNQETGGTLLHTGSSYSPQITENTTLYIEDAGVVSSTIGEPEINASADGWYTSSFTELNTQLLVQVTQNITLASVNVSVENNGTDVSIQLIENGTVAYTHTEENVSAGMQTIPLNFNLVPGEYTMNAEGTTNSLYVQTEQANFPYSLPDYVSFSNAETWATGWYGMFYNWVLESGSQCVRTPVQIVIDSENPDCNTEQSQEIVFDAGWNLFSTHIDAHNDSISHLFAETEFTIIKNANGFFKKNQPTEMQSIQTIQSGEAYLVFMESAANITFTGSYSSKSTSSLHEGWNLLGIPVTSSVNVVNLPEETIIIKDFNEFHEPENNLGTLSELVPGKGYYIYVNPSTQMNWQ